MKILSRAEEILEHRYPVAMLEAAKKIKRYTADKEDVAAALDKLKEYFKHNKHREAEATMLALLLWDGDKAVARIRREGLLRASRYEFRSGAIPKALNAALSLAPVIILSVESTRYLQSASALQKIAPEARRLKDGIIARLKRRSRTAPKTLLAIVNQAFSCNWRGNWAADTNTLRHWSAEDLSQALSYLINLIRREISTAPKAWQHVDERCTAPFENIYANLLIDAGRLNELLEVEALIDCMPYEVAAEGDVLKVFAREELLGKSIHLGYIQSNIQETIRAQTILERSHASGGLQTMARFVAEAFQAGMGELVQLRTVPIERLVFTMINDAKFFEPIASDRPFAEEIAILLSVGIENFQSESGFSLQVSENLTVMDILKVQRFFAFVHAVFEEKLCGLEDEQQRMALRMRSTLPVINAEELHRYLEFIISREKAAEAIKLLTLAADERYIDLQYKPLIELGPRFIVAPALLSRSNLVRNIVVANKLHNVVRNDKDPMEQMVIQAFGDAGFKTRGNFHFDMEGKRETDLICWRDGHLFVFECKNAYHPCSAHETRTSYGHLEEAACQLDIRLSWIKSPENQERLLKWLNWDVPVTQNVHSGIITGNRVFNGYIMGQHPVRQAHELMNVIKRGQIRIGAHDTVRFWRNFELHALDLVDYLQGESIIRQQFEQMSTIERRLQIGKVVLLTKNYAMDMEAASDSAARIFGAETAAARN